MVNVENDVYDYGVMILIDLDLIILMIYEFVLFEIKIFVECYYCRLMFVFILCMYIYVI